MITKSATVCALSLTLLAGCTTSPSTTAQMATASAVMASQSSAEPLPLNLREGDVLRISFPGTLNLDTEQAIRRDGRITLPLVGEVVAAGLTPSQLEKRLLEVFSGQINTKEVTVAVVSSQYSIFVTGAVARPGKIQTDRPLTALEAIMEAGGFDNAKANPRAVTVIRNENGRTKNYTLDIQAIFDGKESQPFLLKPSDVILVPERFTWF